VTQDERTTLAVVIERLDQQDRRFGDALDRIEQHVGKTNGSLAAAVDRIGGHDVRLGRVEQVADTLVEAGRKAIEFRRGLFVASFAAGFGAVAAFFLAHLAHIV